jgi:anti-sigma regulatory factor (Ser/Thr protein kinase)
MDDPGLEVRLQAAEAVVPNRPDSTPAARAFLTRLLNGWGVEDEVIDDASLLTTELVANAVRHGAGNVKLRVEVEDGVVQVRVHDQGTDVPTVRHADSSSMDGRGLWIVECVADEWGSDREESGKSVWFRLSGPPTP